MEEKRESVREIVQRAGKVIVVGLTGALGSGKTEAARIFKSLGAEVFDADRAARRAVRKGQPAYRGIVKLFGRRFVGPDGEIDRKKLGRHVFARPGALKKLNILVHPEVIFDCIARIERLRQTDRVLVLDAPLLFESKMEKLADRVVFVSAPKRLLLARAKKKGLDAALAKRILASQWPAAKKARLADFVVDNDGSLDDLRGKIRRLFDQLKKNPEPVRY